MLIILVFDIYGQFKFLWSMCICYTVKYNYASIDIAGQSNDEECQFAAKIARNLIQPQQSPINTRKMCARFDICAYYSVRVNRLWYINYVQILVLNMEDLKTVKFVVVQSLASEHTLRSTDWLWYIIYLYVDIFVCN